MKLNQLGRADTSRKQILVFVNGLLQQDGVDYEWDSIEDIPIFKHELFNKDFVIVLTIDATFGSSRKEYEVENSQQVTSQESPGGSILIHEHDDDNCTYDENGNCTGGYVSITAGDGLSFEDHGGGNLILKAGQGWNGGEAGEIKIGDDECGDINIVSSSRINIKAPNITFTGKPEVGKWEMY